MRSKRSCRHGRKQIAVPYVDLVLQVIQQRIDAGAANRGGIDVHGYDAARVVGGKHRADAGSACPCRDTAASRLHELRVDLRCEELPRCAALSD